MTAADIAVVAAFVIGAAFLAVVFCVLLVRVNITPPKGSKRSEPPLNIPVTVAASEQCSSCHSFQPYGYKKPHCYRCDAQLPSMVVAARPNGGEAA